MEGRAPLACAVLLLAVLVAPAAGQVPERPPPPPPQVPDTIPVPQFRFAPPISPLGALWRSLLLPGWGQSVLGRRLTGAVFLFWEGITMTMTLKSLQQLEYQKRIDAETVAAKREEIQDWAVLWGFNHLMAAAEAFVAAQLWDFPAELRTSWTAAGTLGARLNIRF